MDVYEYDINADAFSLCKQKYDYAYSIDITSEIILDVDSKKNLIGIEFLDASKVLNVKPELLIQPKKIVADVVSTDKGIMLVITFEFNDFSRKIDIPINNLIYSTNALVISV